ncbi:MAG TPA: peptidoglycan-binding domain-containing protein, partial [Acidimicrobiia bacterium]|nr:peptidoglycan-binding domain-containing protein [Acidimicrobiia bacterium]
MNRLKTAAIFLLATTIAFGTGWTAISLLDPTSPTNAEQGTTEEQAAGPSAPMPAGGLRFSATVGYSTRQAVRLAPTDSAVVTRPPQAGAVLTEGSLALEVSGRPVRVLAGAVTMSRDLSIGGKGDDVLQLEQALSRLGFRPGEVDGLFDAATAAAVHAWYADAGYPSQGPSDEDQEKLRTLQAEVDSAEGERLAAAETLDTLRRGVESQDLADAQIAAHEAQGDVEEARSQGEGPGDAEISLHESERAVGEARSLWNDAKGAESEARAAEQAAAAAVEKVAVDGAAQEADAQAELTESENELINAENVRRITEEQLRQAEEEWQKAKSKSDKNERREQVEQLRAQLDEAVREAARARATVEAHARRLETVRAATAAATREAESHRQAATA